MSDESKICAAALFCNKGKDVITVKEFTMYVSLDLRWMPVKDANQLVSLLISERILTKTGDYLKPAVDFSEVEIPIAYKPSPQLLTEIRDSGKAGALKNERDPVELFSVLLEKAASYGLKKGPFISECNRIVKKLNIDIEIAALIVLAKHGTDIGPYVGDARACILGK